MTESLRMYLLVISINQPCCSVDVTPFKTSAECFAAQDAILRQVSVAPAKNMTVACIKTGEIPK